MVGNLAASLVELTVENWVDHLGATWVERTGEPMVVMMVDQSAL